MDERIIKLDGAIQDVVGLLRAGFRFSAEEEAKIASLMGTFRDALGQWRTQKAARST